MMIHISLFHALRLATRRPLHVAAPLVVASAGLATGCASESAPSPERVASTSEAVAKGTFTGPNLFQFVPLLSIPTTVTSKGTVSGQKCSGILVAPSLVLTANHCITGEPSVSDPIFNWTDYSGTNLFTETIGVTFSDQTSGACPDSSTDCQFNSVGTIAVQMQHSVNMSNSSDFDNDLAVLQLNAPVPGFMAKPVPVAGLTWRHPTCPSSFDQGTLVGFGPIDAQFITSLPITNRNFTTTNGWFQAVHDNGASLDLENSWAYTDTYQGIEPGDSGGPLLINAFATGGMEVCGVSSKRGPAGFFYDSVSAEVDSPNNHQFLVNNLLVPGTDRIRGLCEDESDPAAAFSPKIIMPPTWQNQIPACAPPGSSASTLPTYHFMRPALASYCAPFEAGTVTGAITQTDGAYLASPVPIGSDGMTTAPLPRAYSNYTIQWTAIDAAGVQGSIVVNAPCRPVPGDLNGDYRADIVAAGATVEQVVITSHGAQFIARPVTAVALSNGDASFTVPPPSFVASGGGQTVTGNFVYPLFQGPFWGDVLTVTPSGGVWITENAEDGTGGFSHEFESSTVFGPFGGETGAELLSGDFNGDGLTDFLATGASGWATVPVAFANVAGAGAYQSAPGSFTVQNVSNPLWAQLAAQAPGRVVVGDFDGNGIDDLAATGAPNWMTLPVAFSANGDGTFLLSNSPSQFQYYSNGPGQVLSGDFDGDGRTDILFIGADGNATSPLPIALSASKNFNGVFNVLNRTSSDNEFFATVATQPNAKVVVGDFDGDGRDDLAATGGFEYEGGPAWGTLPVALSNGDGSFRAFNASTTFQQYSQQSNAHVRSSWK